MSQAKITVVGAGNVGATVAHIAASKGLGDVVLLDMAQAKGVYASAGNLTGTTDWGQDHRQ